MQMTDILWWVQLADCTTFEDWRELREILVKFPLPSGAAMGYSWHGEMPDAITIVGDGMPMDVDELFLRWAPHIHKNEYIVISEMQRADILSRGGVSMHVMTADDVVHVSGPDVARYILTSVTDWDGTS